MVTKNIYLFFFTISDSRSLLRNMLQSFSKKTMVLKVYKLEVETFPLHNLLRMFCNFSFFIILLICFTVTGFPLFRNFHNVIYIPFYILIQYVLQFLSYLQECSLGIQSFDLFKCTVQYCNINAYLQGITHFCSVANCIKLVILVTVIPNGRFYMKSLKLVIIIGLYHGFRH